MPGYVPHTWLWGVITALKRHVAVVLMLVCNAACTALLSLSRPDHVVFNVDSDDLLTPGADDDLTSSLTTTWRHRCLARNTRHCSTTLWTDSSYRLVSITTFQATRLPIGTVSRAMFFSYYSSVQSFFSKSKQVQVKSLLSRMNEMDRQRRR